MNTFPFHPFVSIQNVIFGVNRFDLILYVVHIYDYNRSRGEEDNLRGERVLDMFSDNPAETWTFVKLELELGVQTDFFDRLMRKIVEKETVMHGYSRSFIS